MGKYCIFILQRNLHEIFDIIIVLKHALEIHYLNTIQVEILMIFFMLNCYVMIRCFFEILKMKIRSVSIAYSIRKSRDEKEKTLKLENDIQI